MAAAQERGKMAVAYHSDMRKVAPDAQIVAVTHHWGDYYARRVQAVLDGTLEERQRLGRREGRRWCASATSAPRCPRRCRTKCWRGRRTSRWASCGRSPARISDNEGKQVLAKGQALTDEQILGMNFLVAGVQGKIAK